MNELVEIPQSDESTESDCVLYDIEALRQSLSSVCHCNNAQSCRSLQVILQALNKPLDEETAWSLLHQLLNLLRNYRKSIKAFKFLDAPEDLNNICLHPDGRVHLQWSDEDLRNCYQQSTTDKSDKSVLERLGMLIYQAIDFKLAANEQSRLSQKFQDFFKFLVFGNVDNEQAFKKFAFSDLKFLDYALEKCKSRIVYELPTFHYMNLCMTLYEESLISKDHGDDNDDDLSSSDVFSVSDEHDGHVDNSAECEDTYNSYIDSVWEHSQDHGDH